MSPSLSRCAWRGRGCTLDVVSRVRSQKGKRKEKEKGGVTEERDKGVRCTLCWPFHCSPLEYPSNPPPPPSSGSLCSQWLNQLRPGGITGIWLWTWIMDVSICIGLPCARGEGCLCDSTTTMHVPVCIQGLTCPLSLQVWMASKTSTVNYQLFDEELRCQMRCALAYGGTGRLERYQVGCSSARDIFADLSPPFHSPALQLLAVFRAYNASYGCHTPHLMSVRPVGDGCLQVWGGRRRPR